MDIITAEAKKNQASIAKLEELRNRILSEIEKVLKSAESERLLLLIDEGKNLSEKEVRLVNLRTIILEATSRSLLPETGYQGSRLLWVAKLNLYAMTINAITCLSVELI